MRNKLVETIKEWNNRNPLLFMDVEKINSYPRNILKIKVVNKSSNKLLLEFNGYEGEELLYSDIIPKLKQYV